jgi:hypothetical protein
VSCEPPFPIGPSLREEIRRRGCFVVEDFDRAGFSRVYSGDPRFPISAALPGVASCQFDRSDPVSLKLELRSDEGDLFVGRLDLRSTVEQGRFESRWAREVIEGRRDEVWFTDEREKLARRAFGPRGPLGRYRIERHCLSVTGHRASRMVSDGRTARVFLLDADTALWNVGSESLDGTAFDEVLSMFCFLSADWLEAIRP